MKVEDTSGYMGAFWKAAGKTEHNAINFYNAVHHRAVITKLSKLICYHRSEWSYDTHWDGLKAEINDFYDALIDQEKNNERANKMKQKRDSRLKEIETKVKELSFWDKINIDVTGNEGLKPFPKSPYVYHFNPIAFVEQMKRIYGCFCNRDITIDEFTEIFKALRDSEKALKGSYNLFSASNCNLPSTDKTMERLTDEFNQACKKFNINLCIQKI
ncbi:MAG: hypothetical protein LBU62_01285, partial [Bacteroidales bacterium]|nr:hypothetical protein [Bacteroidales bacterium]